MRSLGAHLADFPLRILDGHVFLGVFERALSNLVRIPASRGGALAGTYGCRLSGNESAVAENLFQAIRQGRDTEFPD